VSQRLLGEKHLKLLVSPDEGQTLIDAIAFNVDTSIWPDASQQQVRLAYRLDINEYRGQQNVQLMVEYLSPV
jgi:single-stranded-DNA-specific exonuclease